jgi:hypothetical protein
LRRQAQFERDFSCSGGRRGDLNLWGAHASRVLVSVSRRDEL